MRVNPNFTPDILADLQTSQVSLNTALQQVSTGRSVNQPSDNPAAAAQMVQNAIATGDVDQYTQNVSTVLASVQSASSALSSVVTSLTQAVSVGTEGATGTNNSTNLQALAEQVQGILTSVVAEANTSFGGSYLFGGTSTSTPFTADASSSSGYTYNGNSDVNSVAVGETTSVQASLPGDQIFTDPSNDVLGSLSNLINALQSGNSSAISSATTAVNSAVNYIGQQQVFYSNAETQLNSQNSYLQQDTVSLSTQQNNLVGVNMATAATNLSQAEVANSAAMAAVAKVLPDNLLQYLSPPD
jgi:flagellar hook-associated protein 3 FlgL